jgi:crotonobetainyl-CoA:carnitine CoA-transferase CaiB-like acyl-CoA transferase
MGQLDGVMVLDFSHHVAGPVCTMMLADLGATVIKIEPPPTGEAARTAGTFHVAGGMWPTNFFAHNRNKKSLVVDLKSAEGKQVILDLAARADAVVENFRPDVMARLGLDYTALAQVNPRLIYCAITAFGPDGPYREKRGLDIVLQAMGGLMSLTGSADSKPVPAGAPIADTVSGIIASVGILAALHNRATTGLGQRVDVPMLDCVSAILTSRMQQYFATGEDLAALGAGHPQAFPWEVFQASDAPFVLAINTDVFWQKLCVAIGLPEMAEDERYASNTLRVASRQEINEIFARTFAQQPRSYWTELFDKFGLPSGPILKLSEVVQDPQAVHNNIFPAMETPGGTVRTIRNPIRFSASPESLLNPPPLLGADTVATLRDAGYSTDQIAGLLADGVIQQSSEAGE